MTIFSLKKYRAIIVPLLVGMIIAFISYSGLFNQAELWIYDNYFLVRGKSDPGSEVLIIAIDEKSVVEFGPLPWRRTVHASLLEKLVEARVVAFDLLFDFPSGELDDRDFSHAIGAAENVVLASIFTYEQDEKDIWYQNIVLPNENLLQSACGSGFINVPVEKGNMIRRISIIDTNYFQEPYPSFSLATALCYYNLDRGLLKVERGRLIAPNFSIPLDDSNQVMINFWGPGGTFPTYSYVDVLEEKVPVDVWSDKIILVGVTTPVMMDYFENPFTKENMIMADSLPAAGVEIHASAVNTILHSFYYRAMPWYFNSVMLLFVWLLSFIMVRKLSPWQAVISALFLALIVSFTLYLLWAQIQVWLNLFAALVIIAGNYSTVMVYNFIQSENERRWIRNTFSRYISIDFINELIKNPEKINLGGEKKQLTVLFADLRNFTAFSEKEDPEYVINRLNEFFSAMASIVFHYKGTLDKYNGDGFMAFFGAPVDSENHALNGLKASVAMISSMQELNAKWVASGEKPLQLGIGLNSGTVVVGNIGSEKRMDYTVIGRVVNIASRLEVLTKEYETPILIGSDTLKIAGTMALPEDWSFLELGYITVPGMTKKVFAYTLCNPDGIKEAHLPHQSQNSSLSYRKK